MITIDRSKLNAEVRNLPINPQLEEFINKVALAKPLCEFSFNERAVRTVYDYTKTPTEKHIELYAVDVHENGERLGGLYIGERYVSGNKEPVYGVESFRIQKERGRGDATVSKDIKVALRNAKKAFVSRADNELRDLITNGVTNSLSALLSQTRNRVVYGMDLQGESLNLAMLAYEARKRGESTVVMPAMPATIKKPKLHDEECEKFMVSTFLHEQVKAKHGYGLSVYTNGSLAMVKFADDSVHKFKSFDALPMDIQSKLAMFKVIANDEPYAHLGCKFNNEMYYIVAGDMNLDN